jgi:hypothetical protein
MTGPLDGEDFIDGFGSLAVFSVVRKMLAQEFAQAWFVLGTALEQANGLR